MYKEEIFYKADYSEIKSCRETIKTLSLKYSFFDIFKENIELSIGELFTNIIKHGQKSVKDDTEIKVIILIDSKTFEIEFFYKGDIPSESKIKESNKLPEVSDIANLSSSGRGIFLMNHLMDEVHFEKNGEFAKAIMKKYL